MSVGGLGGLRVADGEELNLVDQHLQRPHRAPGEDILRLGTRDLRRVRRGIGMIFQEFNLVDRMSVMDNVLSGRLGYVGNMTALFRLFSKADVSRALVSMIVTRPVRHSA